MIKKSKSKRALSRLTFFESRRECFARTPVKRIIIKTDKWMEIFYNGQRLWLLHIGKAGERTREAVCLDEDNKKVVIELNIAVSGCYVFPPKSKEE